MPRTEEIAYYSTLITDLEISLAIALIRRETALVADLRAALIEARNDIWTLLSHDALNGHHDMYRSLLALAVDSAVRSEEAKV